MEHIIKLQEHYLGCDIEARLGIRLAIRIFVFMKRIRRLEFSYREEKLGNTRKGSTINSHRMYYSGSTYTFIYYIYTHIAMFIVNMIIIIVYKGMTHATRI